MLKVSTQLFLAALFVGSTLSNACAAQASESEIQMTLRFDAQVNGAPFRCDQEYPGVGTSKARLIPRDFRFYVSRIRLINASGEAVPLRLEQDGRWQQADVALLDFEDKSGSCEGNAPTRRVVTGSVPAGTYRGLRFDLGVPFELNHGDANRAASPLNLTSLFWAWRSGYKFARLDLASAQQPQGYFIHLGSTACVGQDALTDKDSTSPPMHCENPNRPEIVLPDFQPAQHQIVADLGHLLADSDITQNQPQTAAGCMSGMQDSDCAGIFRNFGLGFAGAPAGPQRFFHMAS